VRGVVSGAAKACTSTAESRRHWGVEIEETTDGIVETRQSRHAPDAIVYEYVVVDQGEKNLTSSLCCQDRDAILATKLDRAAPPLSLFAYKISALQIPKKIKICQSSQCHLYAMIVHPQARGA